MSSQITSLETIDLVIDSLSYNGGRGVGRHEGVVVFIAGVVPGDFVRARVLEKKPRFWEAELVEILKPSEFRREPPCPVADRCGGCSWQQVTYDQQIVQKEKILRDSLRGLAKHGEWKWLPLLRAKSEFFYRNRIQVHVRDRKFGFFAKRSRDLVSFDKCWIAEEKLNAEFGKIPLDKDDKVEIALSASGELNIMPGERDPNVALFAQVNTAQNAVLKSEILKLIKPNPDWIMDLYAGAGNISVPLANEFIDTPVIAVELSTRAITRAKKEFAEIGNIEWHAGDVGKVLSQIRPRGGRGVIVTDPPRTGMEAAVCDQLLRHAPQQIIYVSCNPTTFARDAEKLVKTGRYKLETVQGLDMFPQTEHVELIASLCAAT